MMTDKLKYTILGAGFILGQILLNEYLNLWPLVYFAVFPLFLILLPYPVGTGLLMAIAFGTGWSIDVLSDGVPGLNASAAVAAAYFKKTVLHSVLSAGSLENLYTVNVRTVGLSRFCLLCFLLYAVFFLFYITLDGFGSVSFLYGLMRFLLNFIINAVLAVLLDLAFTSRLIK